MAPPSARSLRLAPAAAALTASALLAQEVLLARLLSVTTWYSLGYLALSLGLLGMSVGALAVHLWPRGFSADAWAPRSRCRWPWPRC